MLLSHILHGGSFQAAGITGMPVIYLLLFLAPSEANLVRIDDNHMIAAVGMWRVLWPVFSTQNARCSGGQTAKYGIAGINHIPFALNITGTDSPSTHAYIS